MELNELDTMLQRADRLDRPVPVEALIEKSMRNARQRARNRRLAVAGTLGTSLAAVGVLATLTLGPGQSVPMSPAASPKPTPSELMSTRGPEQRGALPATAELKTTVEANLPEQLITRTFHTEGMSGAGITFELGDKDGYGQAAVGIDRLSWNPGQPTCTSSPAVRCEKRTVPSGELWIARDQEKPGDGTRYSLVRPNGTRIWFLQRNKANDQADRDDLPLSDQEAIEMITAPAWHELADNLPIETPWDGSKGER